MTTQNQLSHFDTTRMILKSLGLVLVGLYLGSAVSQEQSPELPSVKVKILADTSIYSGSPLSQKILRAGSIITVPVSKGLDQINISNLLSNSILNPKNDMIPFDGRRIEMAANDPAIVDLESLAQKGKLKIVGGLNSQTEGDGDCKICNTVRRQNGRIRLASNAADISQALAQSTEDDTPLPRYNSRRRNSYDPDVPAAYYRRFRGLSHWDIPGSTVFVRAPKNEYTKPETVQKLIKYALDHRSRSSNGEQRCWTFVQRAFYALGIVPPGKLRGYGPNERIAALRNSKKFKEITSAQLKLHPELAPASAIVVYDNPGSPYGDVQMRTENGWISDFYWPVPFNHQSGGRRASVRGVFVLNDQGKE